MANNLFVSYDLHTPGQNYEAVIEAIKEQGWWAKVHYSLFYLKSDKTAEHVAKAVWTQMDENDRLIVINATTNEASWYNLPEKVEKGMQERWYQ